MIDRYTREQVVDDRYIAQGLLSTVIAEPVPLLLHICLQPGLNKLQPAPEITNLSKEGIEKLYSW